MDFLKKPFLDFFGYNETLAKEHTRRSQYCFLEGNITFSCSHIFGHDHFPFDRLLESHRIPVFPQDFDGDIQGEQSPCHPRH